MKYIDNFQGGACFWEIFPHIMETPPFKDVYKADRSKNKNHTSKLMWFIALVTDIDSEYYSMLENEQKEILYDVLDLDISTIIKENDLMKLRISFENFSDTVLSADVRALERKLLERKRFIQDTQYTLDELITPMKVKIDPITDEEIEIPAGKPYLKKGTAAQLDKMMTDTKKIHEEVRNLREALKNAQAEKGKGGREESFLER
jgi:hypothetical protein